MTHDQKIVNNFFDGLILFSEGMILILYGMCHPSNGVIPVLFLS